MRRILSSVNLKVIGPLLIIQVFLLAVVIMNGLSSRQTTSTKASEVNCPPNSQSQGSWCDYRHTTNENDRNAPVLNPNYLDTYNDCWDKCVKLDTTQCNGTCHYGSATVCVQKDAWANNAAQCSFICNWACCGGAPKVSACTGQPVVPTLTKAPVQPTTPVVQPTTPPATQPTAPPFMQPSAAPHITIYQPTQPVPTSIPQGNIDFKPLNPSDTGTQQSNPSGQSSGDILSGPATFFQNVGTRVGYEAKLNSKRLTYFFQGVWYVITKPFLHP